VSKMSDSKQKRDGGAASPEPSDSLLDGTERMAVAVTDAVANYYADYTHYSHCASLNTKGDVYEIVRRLLKNAENTEINGSVR